MDKRLYRSRNDKIISGVCGGIAEYFGIDPVIVRVIAVLTILAGGAGIIAYIILAIIIPLESSPPKEPRDIVKDNVEEIKQTATMMGEKISAAFKDDDKDDKPQKASGSKNTNYSIALILIVLGVLFLLGNLNFFWWLQWRFLWPLVLIVIGLVIILGRRK